MTEMVQLPPTATEVPQVLVSAKFAAYPPERLILLTVMTLLLVLERVTVWAELVDCAAAVKVSELEVRL